MRITRKILQYIFTVALIIMALAICFACGNQNISEQENPQEPTMSKFTVQYETTVGGEISWTSNIQTSGNVRFVARLVGASSHSDITDTMTISDCTSNISIQTDCNVSCGGLLGYFNVLNIAILIENCSANGDIQIDNAENGTAGGFANNISSRNGFVTIQNCYATGDILTQSHANGFSDGFTDVIAFNCYSKSQVIGRYASGFVHTVQGTIRYCYATGNVTASNIACGFINVVHGNIEECYSAGTVYAPQAATDFIYGLQDGTNINCYSSSNIIMTNEDINTALLVVRFINIK